VLLRKPFFKTGVQYYDFHSSKNLDSACFCFAKLSSYILRTSTVMLNFFIMSAQFWGRSIINLLTAWYGN